MSRLGQRPSAACNTRVNVPYAFGTSRQYWSCPPKRRKFATLPVEDSSTPNASVRYVATSAADMLVSSLVFDDRSKP
jgi:hypothetical protein